MTAPRLNDCGFIGTYEEHRAMGCCGPKLNPTAVLQRAARRAAGERDTGALDHCDQCQRPIPHTDTEARHCPPQVTARTWRLDLPWRGPLLTENQRLHWAQKAQLTRTIRDTTRLLAGNANLPRGLDRVEITLHWQPALNRRRDDHNMTPTLKAAVDGLVDYGLTPDDNSRHVLTGCVIEPVAKPAALWLTITEIALITGQRPC